MSELWCEEHDHFKRTCPWCEISEKESEMSTLIAWHNREMKRMQHELNQAIEALEVYGHRGNWTNTQHISTLKEYPIWTGIEDEPWTVAQQTLKSIKGGEYDATQTSD